MSVTSPPMLIGRRYLLGDQLGIGNMGVVYRATDRLTGDAVALKRVTTVTDHVPLELDTEGVNVRLALAHEFQLLSSLRHPHIISVLDYGFDEAHQPYFTMEVLENAQSFVEAGAGQPLSVQVDLLTQTLQALSYLHRRGILHRDLKPANILVVRGEAGFDVRVMDFGLSIVREQQREDEAAGTPLYMAPEVMRGFPATESADLYAVGVLAYELFVGRHPFDAPGMGSVVQNILAMSPEIPADLNPKLARLLQRLLAKTPDARPADAVDVIAALSDAMDQPLPVETAATRESFLQAASLIGRDAEMAQLREVLSNAIAGSGSTWLVGGESGVGKSRLLAELRTLALVRGALVLRGQAVSEGGAPYAVWRGIVHWLALLSDLTAREAKVLKPIVPTIEQMVGRGVVDAAEIDPRGAQTRMLTTVADMIRRRHGATLILLEDLHWADAESIALLAWLNRMVENLPLLIVGSYRDDEAPDLLERLPGMQVLWLDRLNDAAILELSEHILGATGAQPDVIDFLKRETEGNVFFLVEVMRALAEEVGQLDRVGTMELPEQVFAGGVQRMVELRLSRVPEEARNTLALAAVAGRQIDLHLLQAVQPEADLDLWLAICANVAVIDVDEGHWRFAHDKLRDGILSSLRERDRKSLHRKLARATERVYRDDPEHTASLAYHWGMAGDAAREAHYVMLAGEQALHSGAYQKALTFLERALELEAQVDADAAGMPSPAYLRRQLGETCYGLGDYMRARALLREGAEMAEAEGDPAGVARCLNILGNIALAFGEYTDAHSLLRTCIDVSRASDSRLELGKAMRSLGVVVESMGDIAEAKRLYESSLVTLSEVDDQLGMAGALTNLASIARAEGNFAEAKRQYEASLAQFEAIDFSWGIAYTLTNLGVTLEALGEFERARQLHLRAVTLCREIGHKWGTAFCLNNLAGACFGLAEYMDMRVYLLDAIRIAAELQTVPLALDIITTYARLMTAATAYSYAAELACFVAMHSLVEPETLTRAQALIAQIEGEIPHEDIDTARARGVARTLDDVIAELTRDLG